MAPTHDESYHDNRGVYQHMADGGSVLDNLSPDSREALINSVNNMPEGGMPIGMPSTFSDTGRQASGVGEQLDSVIGAPVRQGIHQALTADNMWDALKKTGQQIGADPRTAPTGYDIASKDLDIDNPYVGTAVATAADLAQLPMGAEAKGASAGVENIARKLGVTVEEARNIMDHAAQRIPSDVFEENMRALKDVKGLKTGENYPRLGQGSDYTAFQSPSGKVVKRPHRDIFSPNMSPEDQLSAQVAPSLVNQSELGPKTTTVRLGDKIYQVQDKVTPLDAISRRASRPGGDPVLESLYKNRDRFESLEKDDWSKKHIADLDNKINQRQMQLYKTQGINPNIDTANVDSVPIAVEDEFSDALRHDANEKLGNVITPFDMHEGNVGLDKQRNPTIFDTSRFKDLRPENLTPEMKQKILESNIMTPDKKQVLQQALERPSGLPTAQQIEDFKNRPNDENYKTNPIKFVAGKSGISPSENQNALATAIAKLKKAQEAGETVGRQTGVDINSFKDLQKALGNRMTPAQATAPSNDNFIEQQISNLVDKLKAQK
jgi:hypothetical protein